jgi:GNAT superfamily N-acetyltransferase
MSQIAAAPQSSAPIIIRIQSAGSPAARALIAELDDDLFRRYPARVIRGIDIESFEANGGVFAVAYVEGRAVACGGFKPYEGAVEVKRMYTMPAFRRRGIARAMLKFLGDEAARQGFERAVLETGDKQPEAIGLYSSTGWEPIETFGPHIGDPASVCFATRIEKMRDELTAD